MTYFGEFGIRLTTTSKEDLFRSEVINIHIQIAPLFPECPSPAQLDFALSAATDEVGIVCSGSWYLQPFH